MQSALVIKRLHREAMSEFDISTRGVPRLAAFAAVLCAASAAWPAAADTRASAVALVTATVHAPVAVRALGGLAARPAVAADRPRAYTVRRFDSNVSGETLRTIFIDFE